MPIDDDHVLLVPDRRTVKKFDLSRGQFAWEYRESPEMPVNGPPRVLVSAERLLVLHDGRLLIRLDPVNGSKRWSVILGIEDAERAARLDRLRRSASLLRHAADLEGNLDRRRQAALDVPLDRPGQRRLVTGPLRYRHVVAYPSASSLSDDELESMPVVARRQDTGALVQRFVFPATIADVKVKLDPRGGRCNVASPLGALPARRRDAAPTAKEP